MKMTWFDAINIIIMRMTESSCHIIETNNIYKRRSFIKYATYFPAISHIFRLNFKIKFSLWKKVLINKSNVKSMSFITERLVKSSRNFYRIVTLVKASFTFLIVLTKSDNNIGSCLHAVWILIFLKKLWNSEHSFSLLSRSCNIKRSLSREITNLNV